MGHQEAMNIQANTLLALQPSFSIDAVARPLAVFRREETEGWF